ncbi:hypothetical protein TCAL_15619 [Tigriopus californicus]|uniref:Carboxypeptidase regulatory-like domain-containing protein n=2 Tax=Tigriopus californicus TaxID=6832 RepID=A0A553PAC8_TIGCA|nr:hypothetical protein TCAL_15619 [Tigriopus californicus]
MVDIIVRVVNSADNSPLVGVNIGIQRVGGEQYPSQVTNSVGEAIFHILRFGSLSITAEEPGFTTETTNRILNTSPVQEVILALSAQLLPGQLRSVLTWTCCVEDMDIFTISTLDTSCWIDFDVTTCHRGSSGSISFKIDSGDYGSKGGETLEWSGNFPSPDPYTIWVQNYNWEDEISTAGAVVSMFSSNEQSIKVVAPSDVLTNTSFWLVGCFDPNLGLASFQEINLYTNALDDHVLCSIS